MTTGAILWGVAANGETLRHAKWGRHDGSLNPRVHRPYRSQFYQSLRNGPLRDDECSMNRTKSPHSPPHLATTGSHASRKTPMVTRWSQTLADCPGQAIMEHRRERGDQALTRTIADDPDWAGWAGQKFDSRPGHAHRPGHALLRTFSQVKPLQGVNERPWGDVRGHKLVTTLPEEV